MVTWFNRLRDWTTDQSNGIGIRSDYHDQEDDNFATGINASLNIAGLNSPTSNISMGSFKFTNAANGTSASDYATVGQVQSRVVAYAADSVGTDAYAITLSPALAAYAVGQQFVFSAGTANTGAATLNVSGLGAKTIKKNYNVDLSDGDIAQNQMITVIYDGTNFQMQTPAHGLISQSMSEIYAADGGGSDSYAITLSPALSSYATGQLINFKANTKNTGAASLNVNGLGAKTIKKDGGADLADGDISANQIVQVIYDGTNFQLLSQVFGAIGQNGGSVYAADVGGTDSYAITLSPAPTAYTTGMVVRFKANTLNTGAATLSCNSIGAITIKKFGSTNDLATGDILANQIVEVIYDGTNFQMISCVDDINNLTTDSTPDVTADYVKTWDASASTYKKSLLQNLAPAAAQSDQETATSTTTYVTPGRQQYHPSANKAAVSFNGTGTVAIRVSYNVTSITDHGVGDYTVNLTTAFSTANYYFGGNTHCSTTLVSLFGKIGTAPTASALRITTGRTDTQAATDCEYVNVSMSGDQ
jgi:hypothetical protein